MNPIIQLAASAVPGEKKYVLFAGAGVSKDAGVPTGWDLILKTAGLLYAFENEIADKKPDLEKWFLSSQYASMTYSQLIDKLYPTYPEQQAFLREYLNGRDPGEVHKGIAELAYRGVIRCIITTNFDHHIEQALEAKGLDVQVIATEEDLEHSEPLIQCKAVRIYKPHGDLGRGILRNTPKDVETLPKLFEDELARVLNEHGVIVLGYSGADKGLQQVFMRRQKRHYSLFWVNPASPTGNIRKILDSIGGAFIPCEGAAQFLNDYFQAFERLNQLIPSTGSKASVFDLKQALERKTPDTSAVAKEFLEGIYSSLESLRPDFSQFQERDDAIMDQIEKGAAVTTEFLEGCKVVCRFKSHDAIKIFYAFFGKILTLYDVPRGFSGSHNQIDFDGFKFLGYEMFVGFMALLIRYELWGVLSECLSEGLFLEKDNSEKFVDFERVSVYVGALDEVRNKRLNLNRLSVMADQSKSRFGDKTRLAELISHREFMEADYFLFLRTLCHLESPDKSLWGSWCPRSCLYLHNTPKYLAKAESRKHLGVLASALGFTLPDSVGKTIQERHSAFERFYSSRGFVDSPLEYFEFEKVGSRP